MKDPDERLRALLFGDTMRPAKANRLALACGVSATTIGNWKRRPGTISVSGLRKLCMAQGIEWEELGKAIGDVERD